MTQTPNGTPKPSRHPVAAMASTTRALRDHARDAHQGAAEGASQARQASAALAALDMDKIFAQLREMVALISDPAYAGGTPPAPRQDTPQNNVVAFPDSPRSRDGRAQAGRAPHKLAAE